MEDAEPTYTLLQFAAHRRDILLEEGTPEDDLNDLHTGFSGILHDFLCGTENRAFTVIHTADGEPFIDWLRRTESEWMRVCVEVDAERTAAALLRKMLGQ